MSSVRRACSCRGRRRTRSLRARWSRLLARAVALEPDDAVAHADLAWATRDLTLADRLVVRWPDVPHVRRSRLRARLDVPDLKKVD